METTQPTRVDQNIVTPDTGCSYSPTCLSCPLPVCKEDAPDLAYDYHLLHRLKQRLVVIR